MAIDYLTELEMYGGPPRRPQFIDRERLQAMAALRAQAEARLTPPMIPRRSRLEMHMADQEARLTPARATVRDGITETEAGIRARIQDQAPRMPSARVQDQAVRAEIEAAHAREAHRAAVNRARGVAQRPAPFRPRPIQPGELEIGPFRPRPMPLPMPRPGPGFAPTMPTGPGFAPTMPLIPRMTRPDPGFYRYPPRRQQNPDPGFYLDPPRGQQNPDPGFYLDPRYRPRAPEHQDRHYRDPRASIMALIEQARRARWR
jgi:hypothetical protein